MNKGCCVKPSPDVRVVRLLLATALDNEPDGDVIASYLFITNGTDGVGMTLKVTELGHRRLRTMRSMRCDVWMEPSRRTSLRERKG